VDPFHLNAAVHDLNTVWSLYARFIPPMTFEEALKEKSPFITRCR